MQNPIPGQISKSSTGLDENIAALLAYAFGWVSGLVAVLSAWILCLLRAYQGQFFKLPFIGNMTANTVNK